MSYYREIPSALIAGAVTGALVLGIAGRGATAGIALVTGNALNLSLRGVLEVLIVGTLVGAIGGVLLLVLKSVCGAARLARGAIVGVVLFSCSALVSWVNGKIAFSVAPTQLFTLIVMVIMFIVYGVCADALLARFEDGGRKRSRTHSIENLSLIHISEPTRPY